MSSTVIAKVMDQGRSVWIDTDSVTDDQEEYRFSGLLSSPLVLSVFGALPNTRFTCLVRSGEVLVAFVDAEYISITEFIVTPGCPLHIDIPTGIGSEANYVTLDPGQGAVVEILTHLYPAANSADKFLWLRADQGVSATGSTVFAWKDTRPESLAPSLFSRSTTIIGSDGHANDFTIENRDSFGGAAVIRIDGSHNTAKLLYSGQEFSTDGPAYNTPYTIIMFGEWPDNGQHQCTFGSGYYDGTINSPGGFWGVEGGHYPYFGSRVNPAAYKYNNPSVEIPSSPCIIAFTCDGGASTQIVKVRLPGGAWEKFTLSGGAYYDTRIKTPPYIGGIFQGGTGYNNQFHSPQCYLSELLVWNRELTSVEVEEQVARLTAQHGIDDVASIQPSTGGSSLLLRAGRGIDSFTGLNGEQLSKWYDTRLSKTGSVGSYMKSSAGYQLVNEDGSVYLPDTTGYIDTITSDMGSSAFAATAGMSSFSMGIAMGDSSVGDATRKNIMSTMGFAGGNGAQISEFDTSYDSRVKYAAGTTGASIPKSPAADCLGVLAFDRSASANGTETLYRNSTAPTSANLSVASATASPTSTLFIGGQGVAITSGTGDSVTGSIYEIFYSTSAMKDADVAKYISWLEFKHGLEL